MKDHPSRITLERRSVGDLPEERLLDVDAHVRGCDECATYLAELRTARDARLAAVPAERFVAEVAARRDAMRRVARLRRARIGAAVATMLAAAAAVLFFLRHPGDGVHGGGVTLKGSGVSVYRSRDGQVQALAADDRIRAGDALGLVVTQSQPGAVAAWFIDAHGQVDRFLPEGTIVLPAGESRLPGSAIVERPCVDLELVLMQGPMSVDDLERRMREADGGGRTWVPPGAIVRMLRCE